MDIRTVTIKDSHLPKPKDGLRIIHEDFMGGQVIIELSYDALMDLDEQMHTELADIIADKVIDKFLQISDEGGLPQLLFDATGMIPNSWKEDKCDE